MTINFNTGPYFDDFDAEKNFYRVLFKPGYAVQARELNQLQSILQHQVTSVGNHLFKKNSMVIPGGIVLNKTADIILIQPGVDVSTLIGKTITYNDVEGDDASSTTITSAHITAVVLAAQAAVPLENKPAALYIKYIQSKTAGTNTITAFTKNDDLRTIEAVPVQFSIVNTDAAISVGKVATIARGTFFTKDIFVDVAPQTIIIETDNTTTNALIGLNVVESIVTSDEDSSLLDNAAGYPNQYAPGADRYKIELVLTRVDLTTSVDDDNFIKMMQVENNVVTYLNDKTQYAELMKTLARRTYDANGNFIVKGLETTAIDTSDDDYISANVGRGKCYLGGYEYEQIADTPVVIDKPRIGYETTKSTKDYTSDLPYFFIGIQFSNNALTLPSSTDTLVPLWNSIDITLPGATIIGYCVYKYVEYFAGNISSTTVMADPPIYKMFFDSINFKKGYGISDVCAVGEGGLIPVLHQYTLNNLVFNTTPGEIAQGQSITDVLTDTSIGTTYCVNIGNVIYGFKDVSNAKNPVAGSYLQIGVSTCNLTQTFVSNYTPDFIPMFKVDTDIIKTISNASYCVTDIQEFEIETGTTSYNSEFISTDEYTSFREETYLAFIGDEQEPIPLKEGNTPTGGQPSIVVNSNQYTVYLHSSDAGDYDGKTLKIQSVIRKNSITPGNAIKKNNSQHNTITITTPSKSWMALGDPDIVKLDKVVAGKTYNISTLDHTSSTVTTVTIPSSPTLTDNLSDGNTVVIKGLKTSAPGLWTISDPYNIGDIVKAEGFDHRFRLFYCIAGNTGSVSNWPGLGSNWELYWIKVGNIDVDGDGIWDDIVTTVSGTNPGSGVFTINHSTIFNGTDIDLSALDYSDAIVAVPPNIDTDTEITSNYILDRGTTGSLVGTGMIKQKPESASPQGQVAVKYYYYGYTVNTAEPTFASVDSYGIPTSDVSYIGEIVDVEEPYIETRKYIDFRTKCSKYFFKNFGSKVKFNVTKQTSNIILLEDLNLSHFRNTLTGKYIAGPDGIFEITKVSYDNFTGNTLLYILGATTSNTTLTPVIETKTFTTNTKVAFLAGSRVRATSSGLTGNPAVWMEGNVISHSGTTLIVDVTSIGTATSKSEWDIKLFVKATNSMEGTYYIGLGNDDLSITGTDGISIPYPVNSERFTYTYTKFTPREVMVYVDRQEDLLSTKFMDVDSIYDIAKFRRDPVKLPLAHLYMPPYTLNASDVVVTNIKSPVYQMIDIDHLKDRVDRNEYYTSLALNRDVSSEIAIDSEEDVNTSKYGFWNEDFMDLSTQDYQSNDFSCTIYDKSYVSPGTITKTVDLKLNDTNIDDNQWKQTGSAITLPYKESRAFNNDRASRFNNLNPFNTIQWNGKLVLNPSVDNWTGPVKPPVPGASGIPGPGSDSGPGGSDPVLPKPPTVEIVTEITNIRTGFACSKSSKPGNHSISFDWKTSTGRTGRVNTDRHLSKVVYDLKEAGTNGDYAKSLINKKYNDPGVKEYLNAGRQFDHLAPETWKGRGSR